MTDTMKTTNRALALCAAAALCAAPLPATAQTHGKTQPGKLTVEFSTTALDSLTLYSQKSNHNQTTLEGFRIQIYSGSSVSSRQEAMREQGKFASQFPATPVYVLYDAPFWRVRVGDYRSKTEALPDLARIRPQFVGCYVVKDNGVRKKSFR